MRSVAMPRLMRLVPVLALAGLDDEWYRELAARRTGAFHNRFDDPRGLVGLGFRDLEQQLVMDLQQHAGLQLRAGEGCRDAAHRALDDVGRRALQGRVDRLPLGPGPAHRVGVADPGDEAFPSEDRLDIAGTAAIGLDLFHTGADRREALEIG